MKKSGYSDCQILSILTQSEAGTPIPELCREHGMSSAMFYQWRRKFSGMDASVMGHLKELEAENRASINVRRLGVERWPANARKRVGLVSGLPDKPSGSARAAIITSRNCRMRTPRSHIGLSG